MAMTLSKPHDSAEPMIVAEATLDELKEAVRALRTLQPRSSLADFVEARIEALENLCRKGKLS
ncbi:hypothetical protein [Microvirga rosea]|uniref:hypothetical protein n=1 Tax=Microvirga rosea TaxID=2715425 RepID=UPI001D09B494|nr:hypothetical protein [Microvirga rosea]MCB8822794.1 hypothetical protein [Microvirga rosea]